MKNKKGVDLAMNLVVIAVMALIVFLVVFGIFRPMAAGFANTTVEGGKKFGSGFLTAIKSLVGTEEAKAAELTYGEKGTFYFGIDEKVTIRGPRGPQEYYIKPEKTDDSISIEVKDKDMKEKITGCGTSEPWTFSIGDEKCCENENVGLCIKFLGFAVDEGGEQVASLQTYSKSEAMPPTNTIRLDVEGTREYTFWFNKNKYSIYLQQVTSNGILHDSAVIIIYKFYGTTKQEACGGTLSMHENEAKTCAGEGFEILITKYDDNTGVNKGAYAIVSIIPISVGNTAG